MIEREEPEWAKAAWEFEGEAGTEYFYLKVDEDSTKKEFRECYDYWEDQLSSYEIPSSHQKALWRLLQWLDNMAERAI